jgi:replicative DNA helicase
MPVLSATSRKSTVLAPPLPVRNTVFNQGGLVFRRGQFSLVAAAPGVGKTLFATNLAVNTSVPALYFSADSDEWTVKQRACSILTGTDLNSVETHLNDDSWDGFYADKLRAVDHVDFCYATDIDPEFIVKRMFAYGELRGEWPQLIIVDNLGNTVEDQETQGAELQAVMRELQRLARTTKAHVMALHHVSGAKENGDKPILLGDLLFKLGKLPELVLGLSWPDPSRTSLIVNVPKFRGGKSGIAFRLPVDYTRATIEGFK